MFENGLGTLKNPLRALGLGALLVALAPLAFAQPEDGELGVGPEDGPEDGPAGQPSGEAAGAEPQISEAHVVQSGDTLWDLCGKYLNSPWYWPKIWSYNPQITNPHWIYPGNELRFYPGDEGPTQVAVSREIGGAETDEDDLAIPGSLDVEDLVKSVGPITIQRAPTDSLFMLYRGFVTSAQQDIAGQIVNSPVESQLISDYDRVYVKLKTAAKKGQEYAIYRTVKPIEHPYSGDPYGWVIEIIGNLTIVDTSPQVATGLVISAYRDIERGDYVGPWPESATRRIQPVANEADLKGYIVETLESAITEIGEHSVVFLDKGRGDGVKLGNTFLAYGRGDGFTREVTGLPNEELGRLMVIDVQDHVSTAMVVRSVRELAVGDKVEMKKAI